MGHTKSSVGILDSYSIAELNRLSSCCCCLRLLYLPLIILSPLCFCHSFLFLSCCILGHHPCHHFISLLLSCFLVLPPLYCFRPMFRAQHWHTNGGASSVRTARILLASRSITMCRALQISGGVSTVLTARMLTSGSTTNQSLQ
jgi:hypothetical protein